MTVEAFVLIEVEVGKTKGVAQSLQQVKGIKTVHLVTGPYDIIAIVEEENIDAIGDVITKQVHSIPGISRTTTCIAMKLD